MSLDSFCLLTDLPASVFNTSTLRGLSYADCYLCIQCSILKSYFFRLLLIGCVCMSACRPPQGEEKMKLLSSCRFLTYGPIIYSQTNLTMYTCGCNVLTADSTSERVISLTIVSAYRPIQCGENVLLTVSSRLGISLSVSQTNAM